MKYSKGDDLAIFEGHTQGEWKIETLESNYEKRGRLIGIRVAGESVSGYAAKVNTQWPQDNQIIEQEINARLIAAAPTLLEEVRELRGLLGKWHLAADWANWPEELKPKCERLFSDTRAALKSGVSLPLDVTQ